MDLEVTWDDPQYFIAALKTKWRMQRCRQDTFDRAEGIICFWQKSTHQRTNSWWYGCLCLAGNGFNAWEIKWRHSLKSHDSLKIHFYPTLKKSYVENCYHGLKIKSGWKNSYVENKGIFLIMLLHTHSQGHLSASSVMLPLIGRLRLNLALCCYPPSSSHYQVG